MQANRKFQFLIIKKQKLLFMFTLPRRVDTRVRNMTVDRMRATTMIGITIVVIRDISEATDMENVFDC